MTEFEGNETNRAIATASQRYARPSTVIFSFKCIAAGAALVVASRVVEESPLKPALLLSGVASASLGILDLGGEISEEIKGRKEGLTPSPLERMGVGKS